MINFLVYMYHLLSNNKYIFLSLLRIFQIPSVLSPFALFWIYMLTFFHIYLSIYFFLRISRINFRISFSQQTIFVFLNVAHTVAGIIVQQLNVVFFFSWIFIYRTVYVIYFICIICWLFRFSDKKEQMPFDLGGENEIINDLFLFF